MPDITTADLQQIQPLLRGTLSSIESIQKKFGIFLEGIQDSLSTFYKNVQKEQKKVSALSMDEMKKELEKRGIIERKIQVIERAMLTGRIKEYSKHYEQSQTLLKKFHEERTRLEKIDNRYRVAKSKEFYGTIDKGFSAFNKKMKTAAAGLDSIFGTRVFGPLAKFAGIFGQITKSIFKLGIGGIKFAHTWLEDGFAKAFKQTKIGQGISAVGRGMGGTREFITEKPKITHDERRAEREKERKQESALDKNYKTGKDTESEIKKGFGEIHKFNKWLKTWEMMKWLVVGGAIALAIYGLYKLVEGIYNVVTGNIPSKPSRAAATTMAEAKETKEVRDFAKKIEKTSGLTSKQLSTLVPQLQKKRASDEVLQKMYEEKAALEKTESSRSKGLTDEEKARSALLGVQIAHRQTVIKEGLKEKEQEKSGVGKKQKQDFQKLKEQELQNYRQTINTAQERVRKERLEKLQRTLNFMTSGFREGIDQVLSGEDLYNIRLSGGIGEEGKETVRQLLPTKEAREKYIKTLSPEQKKKFEDNFPEKEFVKPTATPTTTPVFQPPVAGKKVKTEVSSTANLPGKNVNDLNQQIIRQKIEDDSSKNLIAGVQGLTQSLDKNTAMQQEKTAQTPIPKVSPSPSLGGNVGYQSRSDIYSSDVLSTQMFYFYNQFARG